MPAAEWVEPPLSEPQIAATGYPIGALPPDRLLPKKKKQQQQQPKKESGRQAAPSNESNALTLSNSTGNSPPTENSSEVTPEKKHIIRLKTTLLSPEDNESYVRRRTSRVSGDFNYYKKARKDLGLESSPKKRQRSRSPMISSPQNTSSPKTDTPQEKAPSTPPKRGPKKIKFISPARVPLSKGDEARSSFYRQIGAPNTEASDAPTAASDDVDNNDYCETCGQSGKFLCCETCPKSFHFSCVDPPLDEDSLPEGEWLCRECYVKRHPPLPYRKGIFSDLLNQLERRNPRQFQLPKNLRERYEGVTTDKLGEYREEKLAPKRKGGSGQGNFSEEDPRKLLDKNGEPILCRKCLKSTLNGTQMAICDKCSSGWHVDCLDPPLYNFGPRWICPAHVDDVARLPRRLKKTKVVDANLKRGFKNKGNIEILDAEEEDDDRAVQDIPFFDNKDTPLGVSALLPKNSSKTLTMDGIVYRLPARSIVLDFVDAVHARNESQLPADQKYKSIMSALHGDFVQDQSFLLSQQPVSDDDEKDEDKDKRMKPNGIDEKHSNGHVANTKEEQEQSPTVVEDGEDFQQLESKWDMDKIRENLNLLLDAAMSAQTSNADSRSRESLTSQPTKHHSRHSSADKHDKKRKKSGSSEEDSDLYALKMLLKLKQRDELVNYLLS